MWIAMNDNKKFQKACYEGDMAQVKNYCLKGLISMKLTNMGKLYFQKLLKTL